MIRCVNENCDKNPIESPDRVVWGCYGDFACNQECYDEARKQMDHFCSVTLADDRLFAEWLGVPVEYVKMMDR